MSTKTILIATRQINGGTIPGKDKPAVPASLQPKEQLTAARKKALGLDDEAVEDLIAKGALVEVPAHIDENGKGDPAAVKAAEKRATDAEAALEKANEEIAELKGKLEAALKAAPTKAE